MKEVIVMFGSVSLQVSMKEAGDGLHAQMNSMMGALQELKLLQVQTALENLDISGRPINRGLPQPAPAAPLQAAATAAMTASSDHRLCFHPASFEERSLTPSPRPSLRSRDDGSLSQNRSSVSISSTSTSSLESESERSESSEKSERERGSTRSHCDLESVPKRWSGYAAPQADFYGPVVGNPPPEPPSHPQASHRARVVDLPGILYSLSREGPSLDNECSQESTEDGIDWTSSLMSSSRNRQPLVLGDNVFADLVGNWLDLPEVEREEEVEEEQRRKRREERAANRADTPSHPLRLSRSQEICRKFSLTTNIFKKFLRSVRPDRDKLLKERPGWAAPELPEGDLFKRQRKAAPKCSKGSFYLPFWANGQQGKGKLWPHLSEAERNQQPCFPQVHPAAFTGIYFDRTQADTVMEKMPPLFDYNTAVWV